MTRQEIEACFLLAGIHLYSTTPHINTYPGMQTLRGPIWECHTNLGMIRVGYRKRVVEINWSAIGELNKMPSPPTEGSYTRYLHGDDVDQGSDYIHAYSLPNVARYLQAFKGIVENPERFTRKETR